MKFTTILAVLASAAAVYARSSETNAERLARGLPPMPPARRGTPIAGARRSQPSGISNSCNTGPVHCCNSVTHANDKVASLMTGLLGIVVGPDVAVGLSCSPLTLIGRGKNTCKQQPVCCEHNHFNGLVMVGCSPININA